MRSNQLTVDLLTTSHRLAIESQPMDALHIAFRGAVLIGVEFLPERQRQFQAQKHSYRHLRDVVNASQTTVLSVGIGYICHGEASGTISRLNNCHVDRRYCLQLDVGLVRQHQRIIRFGQIEMTHSLRPIRHDLRLRNETGRVTRYPAVKCHEMIPRTCTADSNFTTMQCGEREIRR